MNDKAAYQSMQIRKLICGFNVHIQQTYYLKMRALNIILKLL